MNAVLQGTHSTGWQHEVLAPGESWVGRLCTAALALRPRCAQAPPAPAADEQLRLWHQGAVVLQRQHKPAQHAAGCVCGGGDALGGSSVRSLAQWVLGALLSVGASCASRHSHAPPWLGGQQSLFRALSIGVVRVRVGVAGLVVQNIGGEAAGRGAVHARHVHACSQAVGCKAQRLRLCTWNAACWVGTCSCRGQDRSCRC